MLLHQLNLKLDLAFQLSLSVITLKILNINERNKINKLVIKFKNNNIEINNMNRAK